MRSRIGIILAAGKGTRLKSDLPKVLHPVLGKSILQRVVESLLPLDLERLILVVGHQADRVQAEVTQWQLPCPIEFVIQEPQLGTGHALMQVLPILPADTQTDVLITCGDMPLIQTERYQSLLETHLKTHATASLTTVSMKNPYGYGRIIQEDGKFLKIVEEKDASPEEKQIPWGNAGIYAVDWPVFSKYLSKLDQNNAQGEFYLTDMMGHLVKEGHAVSTVVWPSEDEILGINSRHQLAEATTILSRRTADRLMTDGVTLINPDSMALAPEIKVGADTVIYPGCYLEGQVEIGSHCEIGPQTVMRGHIQIGQTCKVVSSFLERFVQVGDRTYIGPFAHLRDNAIVGEQVRIGNFVEVKETRFGSRSNAAHLCYLGDAQIGDDVNMGAGSIIANYDPIRDLKHVTEIQDGVKIGCNSVLISPVVIKKKSSVAAGSVITEDVESGDLAIARGRQVAIPQWVNKTLSAMEQAKSSEDSSCTLPT